jgi:ABC-2 type transport system permease protein
VGLSLALVGLLAAGLTTLSLGLAYILKHHSDFFSIVGVLNLPIMLLSSALMPLESMPRWMATIARVNPMTFAIEAARALMLRGWDWREISVSAVGLVVFDVAVFLWARRLFQRPIE